MRKEIIQAIKNFDIDKLSTLLHDEKPYMDVSKSLFLRTLKKKFESAKEDGCHSFDDVFFGICESCNKGCEGMTFYSNSGYYLDLFMEGDNKFVGDIYVCNKLLNFTNLEKIYSLGFSFSLDEEVKFKPSSEYKVIKEQYKSLLKDIASFEPNIKLDKLVIWYNRYSYLKNFVDNIDPFFDLDYKLYSKAFSLISDIDDIIKINTKADYAVDALITFREAATEREKLIWFFENKNDHRSTNYFTLSEDLSIGSFIFFKSDRLELAIDISGYEYVMDYFINLDNLYDDLMEKYKPLPKHFEESETGSVEYSLQNHLRIHNKHLDVIEMYNRKDKS